MEVWLDGQNNFKLEGEPKDLMAVFTAISAYLRERGRMAVEVKFNGTNISPGDLRTRLEEAPLADDAKLEVQSEEIEKMVNACLGKLDEALSELPEACRKLAEVFQGDAPTEGFEPFQHIAEIWLHIKSQERMVANALDLDLDASSIGGRSVSEMSEELNTFLEEAAEALKKNDAIALGDLLEYELAPRAEQESVIVAWLQERAAALPR